MKPTLSGTSYEIPGYHLKQTLGKGGMGEVFLAQRLSDGTSVAVKFAVHTTRSRREYTKLKEIDHPRVIKVYDYSEQPQFTSIVMEYVDGLTLDKVYHRLGTQGRLPLHQLCQIYAQIAAALSYIHRYGIAHRDLKPTNVMVARHATQKKQIAVKVMDFGLVKPVNVQSSLTQTGLMMGTPLYMSPDQIRDASRVDQRTDLYSLGIMLYEAVTGQPRFVGPPEDLIPQHLNRRPQPPIELAPDIPVRLNELILALLEKDPNRRPFSAETVLRVLAEISQQHFCYYCSAILPGRNAECLECRQPAPSVTTSMVLNERYAIEALIGQVGCGMVYRAIDQQTQTRCVIKINRFDNPVPSASLNLRRTCCSTKFRRIQTKLMPG